MNIYTLLENYPYKRYNDDAIFEVLVIAESEEEAKYIHPHGYEWDNEKEAWIGTNWKGKKSYIDDYGDWCHPKYIKVTKIGIADDKYTTPDVLFFK